MKIKINVQLKGVDGISAIGDTENPMTLKDVCVSSILTPVADDSEKGKFEKWEIFKKLRDAKEEVTLTAEEITVIKKGIGKFQPPLILGQCFELLEK